MEKNVVGIPKVEVHWQAHRGGGADEAPDNTMAANRYAWNLGGIPEADIRTTMDGTIVCMHDETPARTTDAPDEWKDTPANGLTFAQLRTWDAGRKFDERFAGERIPSLEEVFEEMRGRPERQLYLDLKDVDLRHLGELIDRYHVNSQVIFAHNLQNNCARMKEIAAGVRSMLWLGGTALQIREQFRTVSDSGFRGLDQVQFHLNGFRPDAEWPYELERGFLEESLAATRLAETDLEVLPFRFDKRSIHMLLDIGIRWFATDEPSHFVGCIQSFKDQQ